MNFTASAARLSILVFSLAISGCLLIFLVVAPNIGFPFNSNDNYRLIEIVTPLFFGYLGSASHYVFNANGGREVDKNQQNMLMFVVIGPFMIFIAFIIIMFWVFKVSQTGQGGDAMTFDGLSRGFSVGLGLLAATVSIASAYLFGAPPKTQQAEPNPASRDG